MAPLKLLTSFRQTGVQHAVLENLSYNPQRSREKSVHAPLPQLIYVSYHKTESQAEWLAHLLSILFKYWAGDRQDFPLLSSVPPEKY
jgi:hypothetical protein